MTTSDLLNAAVDVVRQLHLDAVIVASAIIGVAFLLYRQFFGGNRD